MRRLAALVVVVAAGLLAVTFVVSRKVERESVERTAGRAAGRSAPVSPLELPSPTAPDSSAVEGPSSEPRATERMPADPAAVQRPITISGTLFEHPTPGAPPGPMCDVQVSLGGAFTGIGQGGKPVRVETGVDGRFRFEPPATSVRPLAFDLWCMPGDGFHPTRLQVRLEEGQDELTGLELHALPYGELEGVVVDEHGALLEDVRLSFTRLGFDGPLEVVSDERGAFRVSGGPDLRLTGAALAGAAPIALPRPVERREGGYAPLRVVLASATGRLLIACETPAGEPLRNQFVFVSLSPAERRTRGQVGAADAGLNGLGEVTDADGRARFDAVWARQKLAVRVQGGGSKLETRRRVGDRLAFDEHPDARAIVVEPGAELVLRAVCGGQARVHGRVEDERGAPVEAAQVSLLMLDGGLGSGGQTSQRTDERGRFALGFSASGQPRRALLRATAQHDFFEARDRLSSVAWRELELGADDVEVVLTLEATLSVAGRVVGPNGEGVDARVRLVPEEPEVLRELARESGAPQGSTQHDGAFRFDDVPRGRFALEVRPYERFASVRVAGVEAGAEELLVRVERELAVRVAFEVAGAGVELARGKVLLARLDSWGEPPHGGRSLSRELTVRAPGGYPFVARTPMWGDGQRRDERGLVSIWRKKLDAGQAELVIDEGWYWLGAEGMDPTGAALFTAGTGLVRLAAGDYRLRFELCPCAPLAGRVRAADDGPELHVALARADGELIELDFGGGSSQTVFELGADGSFYFARAPVGTVELRVGSAAELRAGRARHRERIRLPAGGSSDLVLTVAD